MTSDVSASKNNSKLRRSLLTKLNIPKKVECRICSKKFKNPILEGSSIIIKTCPVCRDGMKKSKTRRKRK